MQHLIIGAGPSGILAAETLRRLRPADHVTVVGDEAEEQARRGGARDDGIEFGE